MELLTLVLHPHLFEVSEDFFTVRNADSFNITCNTGIIRYSNSMVKGQEMVYDVYKYAGIKRDCLSCSDDIFISYITIAASFVVLQDIELKEF